MTWWMTLLEWIGIIIVVGIVTTGIYTIIAFVTNKILKRRYKPENDYGRKRTEFERSLDNPRQTPGVRMEQPDSERGLLQDTVSSANRQADDYIRELKQDSGDDRKESRLHGYDYDRFKREVLNS